MIRQFPGWFSMVHQYPRRLKMSAGFRLHILVTRSKEEILGNRICLMKHDNMRMGVSPPEGTHKSGRDVQFSPWAEGGNKLFPLTVKVCGGPRQISHMLLSSETVFLKGRVCTQSTGEGAE